MQPLPPKFASISADGGHWTHPMAKEEYQFAVVIDDGSRYRVARFLKQGKHQTMNTTQFLSYLKEGWIQYFGAPHVLRLDPAGAFRSHEMERFCDQHSIYLDMIAGEAHWQLGTCEQAVRGLKEIATKLVQDNPDLAPEHALSEAVRVCNERELIRGFSPVQHVLGRAPDETGRFVNSLINATNEPLLANPSEDVKGDIERMRQAEEAFARWHANERMKRALNSRGQRHRRYYPGDL